ncbi:MAG: DUF1326 domain-containing protein [Proteobacteria bacterium]|nr:DUF1326 domain-containing protein [Pseudomonadota bacterium]
MNAWEIKGREFVNCNCSYGCPCQFNALPTHRHCQAIGVFLIDAGYHGDVRLDGLAAAMAVRWPGAVHEGHGQIQPYVDERADARQREAILRILSGLDTDPGATVFAVFATTYEKVFDPIFTSIEADIDVESRRGRVRVGDAIAMNGQPIRNPVTGAEHRVRIDLPDGFEYELAEIGSGTSSSRGAVALALEASYGQFARLHLNNHGVIRQRRAA